MTIPQHDDSVLSLLKEIDWTCESAVDHGDLDLIEALKKINKLAMRAIAQIEAMSTLDGQRSYALGIEEKRRELEQQSADLGRWPGDPPQSDSDFTRGTCTTAD